MAELLFWPALLAYGEAAVAYVGRCCGAPSSRRGSRSGASASAGSRRPRCSPSQAAQADGFPWAELGRLAQPLRLARRRRVPRLGLRAALSAARARRHAGSRRRCSRSRGIGGCGASRAAPTCSSPSTSGSSLAGFAGFTLAAALAGLYLWQERRLKRHEPRRPAPRPAVARRARRLVARVTVVSLAALTVGIAIGSSCAAHSLDAAMAGGDRGLGRLTAPRSCCGASSAGAAGAPPTWRSPASRSSSFLGLPAGPLLDEASSSSATSHHGAPVELRERVALRPDDARAVAAELARDAGEAVCLSTCNRTELYVAHDDDVDAEARATRGRCSSASPSSRPRSTGCATRRRRCISSASPPGSTRWCRARARSSARCAPRSRPARPAPLLDRLFRQALYAGKKVRAQTAIGESPASVPVGRRRARAAGLRRARRAAGSCSSARARSASRPRGTSPRAAPRSPSSRTGRSSTRAALAEQLRRRGATARASSRSELARRRRRRRVDERARARARRASSSSARCARGAGRRSSSIDLAVPRDLDPAINELDGCYLYDIDDLQAVVAETLAGAPAGGRARRGDRRRRGGAFRDLAGVARRRARRSRRCARAPRRSAAASSRRRRRARPALRRASGARSSR